MPTVAQVIANYKNTEQPTIIKNVRVVSIYTNSGRRVEYTNITNLQEDKTTCKVEFDRMVDSKKTHIKMSGTIEMYEEVMDD